MLVSSPFHIMKGAPPWWTFFSKIGGLIAIPLQTILAIRARVLDVDAAAAVLVEYAEEADDAPYLEGGAGAGIGAAGIRTIVRQRRKGLQVVRNSSSLYIGISRGGWFVENTSDSSLFKGKELSVCSLLVVHSSSPRVISTVFGFNLQKLVQKFCFFGFLVLM
jgi:hypothetical protein